MIARQLNGKHKESVAYCEGEEAQRRFCDAMKTILSIPKKSIVVSKKKNTIKPRP
ncbi:MAG: hypothetical protein V1746_00880 [bacterium]